MPFALVVVSSECRSLSMFFCASSSTSIQSKVLYELKEAHIDVVAHADAYLHAQIV